MSYTLDDVGNRTQRVDQQGTHTYSYDDVYRLTEVTYPGPATTSYTFDAFGNRTSMTGGSGQTDYTYDDADRLTSVDPPAASPVSYTWDDNGNLTNRGSDTFAWDYEERMTSATVNSTTTTFAYRGDGGYAAYHTFQIMDALSNDEGDARWMNAFFKVVNALPWGGLAKTIFDNAVGGIGDPEPVH